jgi:hypothetical protein
MRGLRIIAKSSDEGAIVVRSFNLKPPLVGVDNSIE